ncbi:hypothetical protein OG948_57810 (plasmid) [Embleya sp. NBC_00888]|uniref:hypothetical protein n=1 Tax=Embleya sp. NBC_00888 TaxID=2975960 RepID=UPI002F91006D|nr:hypothetical protein OG948_57810 [Embleya sp. NBC_00888]
MTELVAALLEREPDRRPRSAEEVHERLGRLGTAPAAPGTSAATTVTAPRSPNTTPPHTQRRPARDGAFDISWTGREPITDYARPIFVPTSRIVLVVKIALLISMACVIGMNTKGGLDPKVKAESWENLAWTAFAGGITIIFMLLLLLWQAPGGWRHRHALPNRAPWSLHVGPQGIVTTDGSRRTVTWDQVEVVTAQIVNAHVQYRYSGLHVHFVDDVGDTPLRPAGWFYPGSVASGVIGGIPLCILGPLTEQEYDELTQALDRHAGARWRPDFGHLPYLRESAVRRPDRNDERRIA